MTGISNITGASLARAQHIRQSIADILFTPLGTRVMREDYGSLLPELIDHPQSGSLRLRLAAASYMAISRWEPRILIQRIRCSDPSLSGQLNIDIEAVDSEARTTLALSVPLNLRG